MSFLKVRNVKFDSFIICQTLYDNVYLYFGMMNFRLIWLNHNRGNYSMFQNVNLRILILFGNNLSLDNFFILTYGKFFI